MEYTFVLKDKGTNNQGWWLKLSSAEQLADYIEQTSSTRYSGVLENYLRYKEKSEHMETLTRAVLHNAKDDQTIVEAIMGFGYDVAMRQLQTIEKYGCIFVNRNGGYHADYDGEHKYDFVRRKKLVFPDFKRNQIRIKQFVDGKHFYAYIDDCQVRDGDTLKWDTYEEALEHALQYLNR